MADDTQLRLIVGLGNPGEAYARTRHNAGFMLVERARLALGLPRYGAKFKSEFCKGTAAGLTLGLLRPQTFMNLSGESVGAALRFFKLTPAALLVVHDELDIPLGKLKFKVGGGDAGHNGLRSITAALGTGDYARLRIGIGRPEHKSQVESYVLQPFSASDAVLLDERLTWLAGQIPALLSDPHAVLAKTLAAT
jgi:PTH1 family peptidyl-tRNA hydrolase